MSVISEAEELALSLSDTGRAKLAEKLIASLPGTFIEEDDDGNEEASAGVERWGRIRQRRSLWKSWTNGSRGAFLNACKINEARARDLM